MKEPKASGAPGNIAAPTAKEALSAFIAEVAEYFPGESMEKLLLRARNAETEYNLHWLPKPTSLATLNRPLRAAMGVPYRLWKWGSHKGLKRTLRTLPLRAVLRLCRETALWLGNARSFPSEGALVDQYRSGPMTSYVLSLGRFSYESGRTALIQKALEKHASGRPGHVLDFGSGVAAFSLYLAEAGHQVTLLDVNGPMRQFAQWRFDKRRLSVKVLDHAAALPGGAFDLVLCFDVLEHLLQPTAAVQRILASLRPGGLLFLSSPGEWGHGYGHIRQAKEDWKRNHGDQVLEQGCDLLETDHYLAIYRTKQPAMRG